MLTPSQQQANYKSNKSNYENNTIQMGFEYYATGKMSDEQINDSKKIQSLYQTWLQSLSPYNGSTIPNGNV